MVRAYVTGQIASNLIILQKHQNQGAKPFTKTCCETETHNGAPRHIVLNRGKERLMLRWDFFKCQQCGQCCEKIGLPYDPDNVDEIAGHLNISTNELITEYYGTISPNQTHWESDDTKRIPCPFLSSSNGKKVCTIYEVRPFGCRLFPLHTDFCRDDVDCPGMKIVQEMSERHSSSE